MGIVSRLKNVGSFVKKVVTFDMSKAVKQPVVNNVMPSVGRGAGTGIKAGLGALKNVVARATTNPLSGTTVKAGLGSLGKKVLGGAIAGGGAVVSYNVAKAGVEGKAPNFAGLGGGALVGTGLALNPVSGTLGATAGFMSKIGEGVTIPQFSKIGGGVTIPNFRPPTTAGFTPNAFDIASEKLGNIFENIPQFSTPQITTPINITSPDIGGYSAGFSPSISVGDGGMSSIFPLLAMGLLGGGALGYTLGKRKKKKRKTTKKKRYKKKKKYK